MTTPKLTEEELAKIAEHETERDHFLSEQYEIDLEREEARYREEALGDELDERDDIPEWLKDLARRYG